MASKPAFTLIEVLIGISLISIVSIYLTFSYFNFLQSFTNQFASIQVRSQNTLGLREIATTVRQSSSVVASCPPCGADSSGANILILSTWPLNANGKPFQPTSNNYDYIKYKLDNSKNLIKIVYPDATSTRKSGVKIVSNNITSLQFSYDSGVIGDSKQITISMTSSITQGTKTNSSNQTKKIFLRNK